MISFGRYDLLALLAQGGVAEIWLARQRGMAGFEKLVVVKRLHQRLAKETDYVDMFLDEASINARLQHTNVLQVYELGQLDEHYFLAMEFVEGMPLGVLTQRAMGRLGDLPIAISAGLVVQAARGLHYAHEATGADGAPLNVVHRDVSPLNLLVSYDGILKVADFGIAKADNRRTQTKSGVIKGTPTYMSPEQCSADDVDRRSDVFSLGVNLWELLSGRRLFKRETADETYAAITAGPIPPPSTYRIELPSVLDAITLRALARRPDDRFESCGHFARELEGAMHKEGLRAEVVDVRAFLAEHFAPERAEQEALIQRLRKGETLPPATDPVFRNAEHGLDTGLASSEQLLSLGDVEFVEGDTHREAVRLSSGAMRSLGLTAEPQPAGAPTEEAETAKNKKKLAAAEAPAADPPLRNTPLPARATRPLWPVVLLFVLAIAVAAAIGVIAGRHHQ